MFSFLALLPTVVLKQQQCYRYSNVTVIFLLFLDMQSLSGQGRLPVIDRCHRVVFYYMQIAFVIGLHTAFFVSSAYLLLACVIMSLFKKNWQLL